VEILERRGPNAKSNENAEAAMEMDESGIFIGHFLVRHWAFSSHWASIRTRAINPAKRRSASPL
jgi:hypothetical protein